MCVWVYLCVGHTSLKTSHSLPLSGTTEFIELYLRYTYITLMMMMREKEKERNKYERELHSAWFNFIRFYAKRKTVLWRTTSCQRLSFFF